jgi:hypothetical protein
MQAHAIALPVLERLSGWRDPARLMGAGRAAAYVDVDGFVVALTARGVPLMPNGVALAERAPAWPPPGSPVEASPGRLAARAGWTVAWPAGEPPVWDPTLSPSGEACRLRERAEALQRASANGVASPPAADPHAARGLDRATSAGLGALVDAAAARDPASAARAAALLCGRGPGLTPEGDDLLAGAAATVAAAALACGWSRAEQAAWLAAIVAGDLRARTTALSATLLELAARGQVVEPVYGLLDLTDAGERRWPAALARLLRIGHSTGSAYATATALTALALTEP